MIFLYELYFNRDFQDFISYGVLGSCLMGIWSCICFSSIGDINRERHFGTLPFIYVAPGGFGIIIMGKILGNMILSIVTFAISFATASILSGKMIVIENISMFVLSFVMMFVTLIFYCITAGYAHQNSNIIIWVVGNAFLLCTNICIFHLGIGYGVWD